MIYSILMIYLIIMCWYCYSRFKTAVALGVQSKKNFFFNFIYLFSVISFFVIFIRLMNFFRENKIFDMKILVEKQYNFKNFIIIILVIILIYSLRRLVFFIFKVFWYKIHFFFIGKENLILEDNENGNFFHRHKIYTKLFLKIIYKFFFRTEFYLNLISKISIIILVLIFIYDLILNDFVLDLFFKYLVYFSFFRLIKMWMNFILYKQNLRLDYNLIKYLYPDPKYSNIDIYPEYHVIDKKKYTITMEYKYNIILELEIKKDKRQEELASILRDLMWMSLKLKKVSNFDKKYE